MFCRRVVVVHMGMLVCGCSMGFTSPLKLNELLPQGVVAEHKKKTEDSHKLINPSAIILGSIRIPSRAQDQACIPCIHPRTFTISNDETQDQQFLICQYSAIHIKKKVTDRTRKHEEPCGRWECLPHCRRQ